MLLNAPAPEADESSTEVKAEVTSFEATAPVRQVSATLQSRQPHRAARHRFGRYTIDQLPNGPMPFLIEDILPANCLAEIHGPPGVGKSFAALGIALSIATGRPFLNQQTVQGGALYVAGERVNGLRRRAEAWAEFHGVILDSESPFQVMDDSPQLVERGDVEAFIAGVTRSSFAPSLIVLDTLSRCVVGADENQAREMSKAADALERIRLATEATVLLVHHTRKQGDFERGSTVLRGAADLMFAMKPTKGGGLVLSLEKTNEMRQFEALRVQLVSVAGSAVLTSAVGTGTPEPASPALNQKQLDALIALRDHPTGLSLKNWESRCTMSKSALGRCSGIFRQLGLVIARDGGGFIITAEGLAVLSESSCS